MSLKIQRSDICGRVTAPISKSHMIRTLIASALAGSMCDGRRACDDVEATERALIALAPYIASYNDKGARTSDGYGESEAIPITLNVGESGSTLRFLLPVAAALGARVTFEVEGMLSYRPVDELIECLNAFGADIRIKGDGKFPVEVAGKLRAGDYVVDASKTSQYISGLLFALPLLDGDSTLTVVGERVSCGYKNMTLAVLADFGVRVELTERGYFIEGGQKYILPKTLDIEGDWSAASVLLTLGALAGEVRVGGISPHSAQPDRACVEILKRAGADISFDGHDHIARKSRLKGIEFDATDCPDCVPILAAALSFAEGRSRIYGVERLIYKESDRLRATIDMVNAFGARAKYENGAIAIDGTKEHTHGVYPDFCDHRIAMSGIVAALATEGESEIINASCISKSYPAFLRDITSIGAKITEC